MPVAFVCFMVRGIYEGAFRGVVALKALLLESERVGAPVRNLCHRYFLEGGGGVLGVCDDWLVEVKGLTVASVAAARAFRGLRPRPCPVREGDWSFSTSCRAVRAWVGVGGGDPDSIPAGFPWCIWCPGGPCSRG